MVWCGDEENTLPVADRVAAEQSQVTIYFFTMDSAGVIAETWSPDRASLRKAAVVEPMRACSSAECGAPVSQRRGFGRVVGAVIARCCAAALAVSCAASGREQQSPGTLVFPPYGHSYGIRKATAKELFLFFGPFTKFDDPQGLATAKMRSRDDPKSEGDDDEVVVYGVNSGRNQLIYNTSMWSLSLYGSKGSGVGQFLSPKGIAVDAYGHVYVADWGNNRIVRLYNPKKEVRWVTSFDGKSATDPGLLRPMQVGMDADGLVYVTDVGHRRIVVFDSTGNIRKRIPEASEIAFEDGPTSLAIADGREPWSYYDKERVIFCADRKGTRIWKIRFDGTVEKTVDVAAGGRVNYAAVDYYHNLWLTDAEHHCVLKYGHDLAPLDVFGSYGADDDRFVEPRGIAIWKRFGQTFIAEKTGAQYYWMGTDLTSKSVSHKEREMYTLDVNAKEYSFVSLFRVAGADTTFFVKKHWIRPGGASVIFPDRLREFGPGGAELTFRIEPTYSSYSYFSWCFPVRVRP